MDADEPSTEPQRRVAPHLVPGEPGKSFVQQRLAKSQLSQLSRGSRYSLFFKYWKAFMEWCLKSDVYFILPNELCWFPDTLFPFYPNSGHSKFDVVHHCLELWFFRCLLPTSM